MENSSGIQGVVNTLKSLSRWVMGLAITYLAWQAGLLGLLWRVLWLIFRLSNLDGKINYYYFELYPELKPEITLRDQVIAAAPALAERLCQAFSALVETAVENRVAAACVAALLVFGFFHRRKTSKVFMYLRGIKPEAMIQGSDFVPAEIPNFQVPLYKVGMLYSSFVGYGVRVEDYLALPYHVYQAADGKIMLENKVVLSSVPVMSKVVKDLCYIPVSQMTWTGLKGVRKAGKAQTIKKAAHASCVGRQGESTGLLRTADIIVSGMEFCGSTVPGMSGAAYCLNLLGSRLFAGMHLGTTGCHNIGVTATLLEKEVKKISQSVYRGESSEDFIDVWDQDDYYDDYDAYAFEDKVLAEKWDAADREWSKVEQDLDYNADLEFESAQVYVADSSGELISVPISKIMENFRRRKGVKMTGQGLGEPSVEVADSFFSTGIAMLESRVSKLEEKVQKLEQGGEVADKKGKVSGTSHLNPSKPIKCDQCNRWYATEEAKDQHKAMSHVRISPESAVSFDNKVAVKMDRKKVPFLGMGSQRKIIGTSGPTSPTAVKTSPSQLLLESQSKILAILMRLEKTLGDSRVVSDGQSSEKQPN